MPKSQNIRKPNRQRLSKPGGKSKLKRVTRSATNTGSVIVNPPAPSVAPNPLMSLPTELLYAVCDNLGDGTLASFCRTSKLYHSTLYPLLYRRLQKAEIWCGSCRHSGPEWAAAKGLPKLLGRLIEDGKMQIGRKIMACGVTSGDEETVLMLLKLAENTVCDLDLGGILYRCKSPRLFSILAEEALRRSTLTKRGRRRRRV